MRDIPFARVNEGAAEETIAALENRFHFRLPQDMRQFYKAHNGAAFLLGTRFAPEGCPLRCLYPIGRQAEDSTSTIDQVMEWQEMDGLIPMCYVPFCEDEAGGSYAVRVDGERYGEIHYVVDFPDNPDVEGTGLAAESFSDFLRRIILP